MPQGTSRPHGSSGEGISHFNLIRMRVIGTGNLKLSMHSLQNVKVTQISPLAMSLVTDIEPTKKTNFKKQRAALRGETTEFQEYFRINRIIIGSKLLWTSYPGQ